MITKLSDAISLIKSGNRVFVHGAAATPQALIQELVRQSDRLKNVTLVHLHTEGPCDYASPLYAESFRVINLFTGHNMRGYLDYDRVDYLPCFLSEMPDLFRSGAIPLDVALLHVSPPDQHGYCSLGLSVDVAKSACDSARVVIAQVNPNMPRIFGDGIVHQSRFAAMISVNDPLPTSKPTVVGADEEAIARHVAGLIEDGSTLQMGIGKIPDAVVRLLTDRKDLGIHTEMWSDGTLALIERGVVTNALKKVHPGKCVSAFAIGSKRLYDFMNNNPSVIQLTSDYVNSPTTIARNPRAVSVNSALEVDLTGQICADSIGHRIISGVGGQMDFMRGAAMSKGGKPIIALSSTTKKGESKIVVSLRPGAGVVTTRSHVRYVVTEYGIAELYGKTIGQRAKALISIAHPNHQEHLEREFYQAFKSGTPN